MKLNDNLRSRWSRLAEPLRAQISLRGDINGLVLVIGVLIVLMLLPGPTEAQYRASDILMNDIISVKDWKF